jgi:dimethylamine monooxygenase subunit A
MAMGLATVSETEWFDIDLHYHEQIAERQRLMAERCTDVFGTQPGSDAACSETLTMLIEHLTRVHPDWFACDGTAFHNRLTGEVWQLTDEQPLAQAGCLVQEDLCLIEASPEGPRLTAAVVCFPSRWRLHEKLGRPLAEVHAKVPSYGDRLARPVDRFMGHVRPGHIAVRLNWSVMDDPTLFQPASKWRTAHNATITEQNAGDRLFLRVERQSLRRLPVSGAVLFGIRVHVYPLVQAVTTPAIAAGLAAAVRALPVEMAHYKSLPMFQSALLGWLDLFAS